MMKERIKIAKRIKSEAMPNKIVAKASRIHPPGSSKKLTAWALFIPTKYTVIKITVKIIKLTIPNRFFGTMKCPKATSLAFRATTIANR